jgi:prephenate dehydrogenase
MTTGRSEPAAPRAGDATARAAAAARLSERIAFLGFGLIGGSIALALRAAGYAGRLAAWTPGGSGPRGGLHGGVIDAAPSTAAEAVDGAGLVILAGPPMAVLALLDELAGPSRQALAKGATITDVASTKGLIVGRAEDLGLPFVGGHPMAGRETTGFESATADLFVDRPWVVVVPDGTGKPHVDRVEALARAGRARPVWMSAIDHDLAVATISHLPLIAAAALVEGAVADADRWAAARSLAAGGWRDMTRLARGDAEMGAGILATNARPVLDAARAYRDALDEWIAELDRLSDESAPALPAPADAERLRAKLESARAVLEAEPGS